LEATPGFEPGVKALQASALPLGHVAIHEKSRPKYHAMTGLVSNGADNGIRTRDPHLGKVVLYQLSHVRLTSKYYTHNHSFAQGVNSNFFTFLPKRAAP
jgi:hypothetical protein